jgi:hypothetical protein
MALWNPSDAVGRNEHIGRRLFERQELAGALDQNRPAKTFDLYHFEEHRDREVSLDRLGASSVDRKVCSYLKPRAHESSSLFKEPRSFMGWAVVRAQHLEKPDKGPSLPVIASPIPGNGDDLAANRYHAHVEMPAAFDSFHHYLTAMHLKTIFERHYHFESISKKPQNQSARPPLVTRLAGWVGQMAAKIGKGKP